MSKVKKAAPKTVAAAPRYSNGNHVFILCYAFAGPGQILEGEVKWKETMEYPVLTENGKISGSETHYSYLIKTAKGEFEVGETSVYPSYVEAAKEFSKNFVTLLK
jgi:hypothetical protein